MRRRAAPEAPGHDRMAGLLPYYELGGLTERDRAAFERHALECDSCFQELERGARLAGLLREHGGELRTRPAPSLRSGFHDRLASLLRARGLAPALAGVVLLAAASALILQVREGPRPRELAVFPTETIATGLMRSPGSSDATDELIETGAGWYDLGRFASAERLFAAALERSPDRADAAYLLGLTRARAGDFGGAIAPLERAAGTTGADTALRERTLWVLANAKLAAGLTDEAGRVLKEVIAMGGAHARAAQELLARLER